MPRVIVAIAVIVMATLRGRHRVRRLFLLRHGGFGHCIETAANDGIDRLSASNTTTRNVRQYDMDARSGRQRSLGPARRTTARSGDKTVAAYRRRGDDGMAET